MASHGLVVALLGAASALVQVHAWPTMSAKKAHDKSEKAPKYDCSVPFLPERNRHRNFIYLDLGVNWANTLRLYKDYGFCGDDINWDVYGFEAMPLLIPYADAFVKYLNGNAQKPNMPLPPTGSDHELWHFAVKYDCDKVPPIGGKVCHAGCKQCMAEKLKEELYALKVDEWLTDPLLLQDRLNVAAHANEDRDHRSRYTLLPAAAGSVDGSVNITSHRIGLLHGGGSVHRQRHKHNHNQRPNLKQWDDTETFTVPSVDLARWMQRYFDAADFIVLKTDIEGAEFELLNHMIDAGVMCFVDVLFLECHEVPGQDSSATHPQQEMKRNCKKLRKKLHDECPTMKFIDDVGIDRSTSREIYKKFLLDVR